MNQSIRRYRGEWREDIGWGSAKYHTRYLYETAMGTFMTKREALASLRDHATKLTKEGSKMTPKQEVNNDLVHDEPVRTRLATAKKWMDDDSIQSNPSSITLREVRDELDTQIKRLGPKAKSSVKALRDAINEHTEKAPTLQRFRELRNQLADVVDDYEESVAN